MLFGLTALGFGLLGAYYAVELRRAQQINSAIVNAAAGSLSGGVPEAVLARAQTLYRNGEYDAAIKTYKSLIQGGRADLRRTALYDLGNLYMQQALKGGTQSALESLPLIELAKQSYRDLLREDANDWDARYNLERALWLAPEIAEDDDQQNRPTEWQRRTVRALPDFRIELP